MLRMAAVVATLVWGTACVSTPLEQIPPRLSSASTTVTHDAANGGRVQSIAVDPTDPRHVVLAMQFGGLWRSFNGGDTWFRVFTLPQVYVTDVAFGPDGKTLVATVFRDNGVVTGGGIYVSRDGGDFWTRPPTGIVPMCAFPTTGGGATSGGVDALARTLPLCDAVRTPPHTSAYSVSLAPDVPGLWYVGTDFGIAISADNGATWIHRRIDPTVAVAVDRQQDAAQSVLAMPGGTVLALLRSGLYRSDDRGGSWRKEIDDDFTNFAPSGGNVGSASNKMDRSPFQPWAFVFKRFVHNGDAPRHGFGETWFYELDSETKTLLPLPQGFSRGPFVRVSKEETQGPQAISVWVGEGWDGNFITRTDAASIRAVRSDAQFDDWVSFIAPGGIHADMGDMGLDAALHRAYVGSDGGIFRRDPDPNQPLHWTSAAPPGSGMNSLQITDVSGTNITDGNGRVSTQLYFTTQDNNIWSSPDGGNTWPPQDSDGGEGNSLEMRGDALAGEPVTVAYSNLAADPAVRFTDALLQHVRAVPSVDDHGQPLQTDPATALSQPFYLDGKTDTTAWFRARFPSSQTPPTEIFVSQNNGASWRKRFGVDFKWKGAIARTNLGGGVVVATEARGAGGPGGVTLPTGLMAWIPVETGGLVNTDEGTFNRIGLVELPEVLANRVDEIDATRVILLPANGSLGTRFTEFDTHAILGADPFDWRFVIAPDIVNNVVKVTHDAGATWTTDASLTRQVLRGGQLTLWGGKPDLMEVTEIAFDPYHRGRILVGTRQAGIACSADAGATWRTIFDSAKINYVTGFQFRPDGTVFIGSYGHGLWRLTAPSGCPKAENLPWDRGFVVPPVATSGGVLARDAADAIPQLFVTASGIAAGTTVVGSDNRLVVSGRGFARNENLTLTIRGAGTLLTPGVRVDANGRFSTVVLLTDVPAGDFTIEAAPPGAKAALASAHFSKRGVN